MTTQISGTTGVSRVQDGVVVPAGGQYRLSAFSGTYTFNAWAELR